MKSQKDEEQIVGKTLTKILCIFLGSKSMGSQMPGVPKFQQIYSLLKYENFRRKCRMRANNPQKSVY